MRASATSAVSGAGTGCAASSCYSEELRCMTSNIVRECSVLGAGRCTARRCARTVHGPMTKPPIWSESRSEKCSQKRSQAEPIWGHFVAELVTHWQNELRLACHSYPATLRPHRSANCGGENGRAGEIRTHDLLHPMQARYQATLQPDDSSEGRRSLMRRAYASHYFHPWRWLARSGLATRFGPDDAGRGQAKDH